MDITLAVEPLLAALSAVAGVVPARSPKQVLTNVLLRIDPEAGCSIEATDLEVGVCCRLIGARADGPARLLINPEKLKQILTLSRDRNPELLFHVNDAADQLQISGKGCKYTLPLEDPDLYPAVPGFDSADYDEVAAGDLLKAVKRTACATDAQSTRYALGGVLFEFTADSLTCVGTDGRRLHMQTVPAGPHGAGARREPAVVVPLKALKTLERLLHADDPPCHVAVTPQAGVTPTAVLFRTDSASLYSRLVEGRFPKYADVFAGTENATGRAVFEAGPVLCAYREASITTSEESRGVECRFADGCLTLDGSAADKGASKIEREIAYAGPPAVLSLDARYVIEALQAVDPAATLTARMTDEKQALLFEGDEGAYRAIVMPLSKS